MGRRSQRWVHSKRIVHQFQQNRISATECNLIENSKKAPTVPRGAVMAALITMSNWRTLSTPMFLLPPNSFPHPKPATTKTSQVKSAQRTLMSQAGQASQACYPSQANQGTQQRQPPCHPSCINWTRGSREASFVSYGAGRGWQEEPVRSARARLLALTHPTMTNNALKRTKIPSPGPHVELQIEGLSQERLDNSVAVHVNTQDAKRKLGAYVRPSGCCYNQGGNLMSIRT